MYRLQYVNRAFFGLLAFFCGALCAHLGGDWTSSAQAQPESMQAAEAGDERVLVDGLSIERTEEGVSFTVSDSERTFLVLGTDVQREGFLEWPGEDQLALQTYLPGKGIKVRSDQAVRVYELVAVADCPLDAGFCLPCDMNSCTGPIPPPGGPEPPWMDGFWLNDHVARMP